MSDILFVVPSNKASFAEEFCGTLLLATILKQNALDVDIYRFYEADSNIGFNSFIEKTVNNILSKKPKIVSFYCRCDCYLAHIMISKKIKEISPDIYIVFGGPQADVSAYDTLNEIPWVDFCCRGEGETTVYPLFSALLNNKDYSNINSLTYRDRHGNIVENPVAPLIEDLDSLPYTDYSLVPKKAIDYAIDNDLAAPIDVGRGCPFNCAYCSTSIFWQRKFRIKSADRIINEMLKINETFGISNFKFAHDLFTANKRNVLEFTNKLKASGKDFKWACSSRVDTLDEETIVAMAENGMGAIFIGIESGSERMQKLMNKNLKIKDIINTVSTLLKHDIKVTASFMYGLPEETEEDLEKTLQLVYTLYKFGVRKFQFHICSITQGTPYYYQYIDKLTLALNQSDHVGNFGVEECQDFIKEHTKLFSFCYEYKSEIRDKFPDLKRYIMPTLSIYNKLSVILPDAHKSIKLTELLQEVKEIFLSNPNITSTYSAALEYINRHSS